MKVWKKKPKQDEIIISEPQSLHVEQNGIDNAACTEPSRNPSKESGRSSQSSVGDPSIGDESDFGSDDDYSDFLSDEEISNCPTPAPGGAEKQALKRPKKKRDPIVNSCCGFCSLGAGSLLTGLMYIVSADLFSVLLCMAVLFNLIKSSKALFKKVKVLDSALSIISKN